jgi:hypothetical protein
MGDSVRLEDYMRGLGEIPGFRPGCFYNQGGGTLEIYWRNEPSHTKWINSFRSEHRSFKDDSLVGISLTIG